MRLLLFTLAALGVLLGLTACGHYRLGTGGKLAFTSLYVAPVVNETNLPQAVAPITTQLREAFLRDGRITLVNSPEEADAVLTVTLARYQREALTARADDAGLARKFGLTLGTRLTLVDRFGKKLIDGRMLSVERQVFTDSGQLLAEYTTVPILAEALATTVSHAVLDVW